MTKKIVRVTVFYEDGTFTEIVNNAGTTPAPVTDPLDKNFPWPTIPVVTTPCAKCGSTTSPCYRSDCPTGWGRPWNNFDKVVD